MSAWETVRYRDLGGVLRKTDLKFGNELLLPGAALPSRIVTNSTGETMIQKWVPEHVGECDAGFYDLLDAEIRAGVRLGQMYGSSGNLGHFPLITGYNVDVAEPFVLLEFYRAEPLTPRRLDLVELREFAISLLRALAQTADAGVVHGAVRLASLRWDSQTRFLQVVDFEHALRHGDPRRLMSTISDLSREQLEGAGQADVRDDMWGAGITIRQLALGPHANGAETLPAQVQTLLHGVFADTAAARPHATELLARLGKTSSVGRALNTETALYPGHQLFDQITARKHQPALPPSQRESPRNSAFPMKGGRLGMLAVACVSLLTVIALLVLLVVSR
jgi:hypothetical protein